MSTISGGSSLLGLAGSVGFAVYVAPMRIIGVDPRPGYLLVVDRSIPHLAKDRFGHSRGAW